MGEKAVHRWIRLSVTELAERTGVQHRSTGDDRFYFCDRCGAGPVVISVLDGKSAIGRKAVRLGISNDCNSVVVRGVMDS